MFHFAYYIVHQQTNRVNIPHQQPLMYCYTYMKRLPTEGKLNKVRVLAAWK